MIAKLVLVNGVRCLKRDDNPPELSGAPGGEGSEPAEDLKSGSGRKLYRDVIYEIMDIVDSRRGPLEL